MTDDEDLATIRELLKAGCSLPDRLQKKYDTHMREVRASTAGRSKDAGEQGQPGYA